MPMAQDFRNWKRYRGGWAPDIWLFDLTTKAAKNITTHPGNDAQPMWHGNTIYFLSDRGTSERNNVWAYDVKAGTSRQVTQFNDFDITFPSLGPDGIVFQAGGRLYLLDVPSGKQREVPVRVVTDETTLRRAHREGRHPDPLGVRLTDREAGALRSARRRVHRAGRVRSGREYEPIVRRG